MTAIVITTSDPTEVVALGDDSELDALGTTTAMLPPLFLKAIEPLLDASEVLRPVLDHMSGRTLRLTDHGRGLLDNFEAVSGQPGAMFGVVRDPSSGQFAGNLTFVDPRSFAGVASAIPAVAGALATQAQLARIERSLCEIDEKLDYVIRSQHLELEARIEADLEILGSLYDNSRRTGIVSDDDWQRLVAIESSVRRTAVLSSKHLAAVERVLADAAGSGLSSRLKSATNAVRTDHVAVWMRARIHSDLALTRWESLELLRTASTDPSRLGSDGQRLQAAIAARRSALEDLGAYVTTFLNEDPDWNLLERLRIFSRARLEGLLRELAQLLEAYSSRLKVTPPAVERVDRESGRTIGGLMHAALNALPEAAAIPVDASRDATRWVQQRVVRKPSGEAAVEDAVDGFAPGDGVEP